MNYQIKQLIYDKNEIVKKEPIKIIASQKNIAIIMHVFYIDIWKEILKYLERLEINYDLYITVPHGVDDNNIINIIKDKPDVTVYMTENRGRDVLPFLQVMNIIGTQTYKYICKLHTKKTGDSPLGNVWRKLLYFDLIGSNKTVKDILKLFKNDSDIGIITGKNTILDSERYDYGNTAKIDKLVEKSDFLFQDEYFFAGGTMFWVCSELLEPVMALFKAGELEFEEEKGQKDNTIAHAIERFFGIICQVKNKKIVESPALYSKTSDQTLNEVASLVLSQQYVGNDVFISQKQQIQDFRATVEFKEKEIKKLIDIAESMRIKNRLKKYIPTKLISIPRKSLQVIKMLKHNPAVLKKVMYYLKRGEISYLLTKIKEKSRRNLGKTATLIKIDPHGYFKRFKQKNYSTNDITIDIIIPVYNGYEFLEKLFDSIEKNTTSAYRLIVINDCSPDERVKPYLLERLKKYPDAIFVDHDENQGFLKSVNEAYTYVSNHFLLLNTDTEVPKFWMERLMYPIIHMDKVASTTPFTNSGEIASFPNFVADNEIFDGMSVDNLDAVFRDVNPEDFYAEVPTGVGFCMGVNYTLTKEIGMFVEDTFGKGYGEENDWCQRAIQKGYRNILVPNLFVYHKHGGSFTAEEKQALLKVNAVKLLNRHPNYGKDVHTYIQKDPHNTLRHILVLLASNQKVGTHLIFDHDLGGGANIYANELIEKYSKEEKNILLIRYDYYSNNFKLFHHYKTYRFDFKITTLSKLQEFITKLNIEEIFLNSLVSFKNNYEVLDYINDLTVSSNAKLIIPIHDFYAICPSYTLLNDKGEYCNVPSLGECKVCMTKNMQEWRNFYVGEVNIEQWRNIWLKTLNNSTKILTFSNSSKKILLKAYPDIQTDKIEVIPHKVQTIEPIYSERTSQEKTLTLGILGTINYPKGSKIIKDLVKIIEQEKLNIQVVVIGEITERIKSTHFHATGKYERNNLPSLITKNHIDVCLIPSIIPETFSYTTQEVIMMNLPLIVFNLGAPAERVRNYDNGYVVDEFNANAILKMIKTQIVATHNLLYSIDPVTSKKNYTITIGILGAINHAKGLDVIKQLLQIINRDKLQINIVVIGEISEPIDNKYFYVTGKYKRNELPSLIQSNDIDIFLIPSIWPETFSYTTQEIMMMNMPLMVFDLGAPAERVKSYEKGVVLEKDYIENILNYLAVFQSK